jgi:hypothetical protein
MILLGEGELLLDDATEDFFQQTSLLTKKGIVPPGGVLFFHHLAQNADYSGTLPITVDQANELIRQSLPEAAK